MKRYAAYLLILLLLPVFPSRAQSGREPVRVLFWNLENFFDFRDEGRCEADHEFSSFGEKRWTKKRFYAKCELLAKALLWIGDSLGGDMPDMIGLAEVENAFVLRRLLQSDPLKKLPYRIVHFDSPDPRGIDVALLYRSDRWERLSAKPCHVMCGDSLLRTRDILHVRLAGSGDTLDVLVNHHPSKYGGAAASRSRREAALTTLRHLADTLSACGNGRILAFGDFNDTPDKPIYKELLFPRLHSLCDSLYQKGRGTIRYQGKWELIDQAYVSAPLLPGARMDIVTVPFLMTRDNTHPGDKPLRTYEGPRYKGGVSDHLPIVLVFQALIIR